MAKKNLSHKTPTSKGVAHLTPNPSGAAPSALPEREPDLVRKFMAENPKGTLVDPPEEIHPQPLGEDGDVPPEQVPAAQPEPQVEPQPGVEPQPPSEPPAEEPPAAAPSAAPPAAEPQPETPPVAQPQAQTPAPPSIDPQEKIALVNGSEPWTREQIVAGLQERAKLQPLAEEATGFRKLFGQESFEQAKAAWEPTLQKLAKNPSLTAFVEQVISADPDLLAYLEESAKFYQTQVGTTPPAAERTTIPTASSDPRIDKIEGYFKEQFQRQVDDRARNEWQQIRAEYPFFDTDPTAREGLIQMANALHDSDMRAGKDELSARGLLDVVRLNKSLYDSRKMAEQLRQAPPAPRVDPAAPPQALLGATPPPAAASVRAPASDTIYTGDPDKAVAAFLKDHPGN